MLLHHYTDVNGLQGILRSGKIWATHSNYLNDSTELRYGHSKAREFFFEKQNEISSGSDEDVFLIDFIDGVTKQKYDSQNIYISCFSTNGDILSQWRGYGSHGLGYSICLKPTSIGYPQSNNSYAVHKVKYGQSILDEKLEEIYRLVRKSLVACLKFFPDQAQVEDIGELCTLVNDPTYDQEKHLQHWKAVKDGLVYHANYGFQALYPLFKNDGFREEEEWRIINRTTDSSLIRYRASRGMLVPFVELPLFKDDNEQSPVFKVVSVTCGPNPHPENTKKSVEMFIETLKSGESLLGEIEVKSSQIPYRSW